MIKVHPKKFFVRNSDTGEYEPLVVATGQTASVIRKWLNEHPEATTSVKDGSITMDKFHPALKLHTIKDYVTPQMFGAKGDGMTDDTEAILKALSAHDTIVFPCGTYLVSSKIHITEQKKLIGIDATLKCGAIDFLFDISTYYTRYAEIDGFVFDIEGGLCKIHNNLSWGGCAKFKNCVVNKTVNNCVLIEAGFNCSFENVSFLNAVNTTNAPLFLIYGLNEATIANMNRFSQCVIYGTKDTTTISTDNTKNTIIDGVSFEVFDTAIESMRSSIYAIGCWFEDGNRCVSGNVELVAPHTAKVAIIKQMAGNGSFEGTISHSTIHTNVEVPIAKHSFDEEATDLFVDQAYGTDKDGKPLSSYRVRFTTKGIIVDLPINTIARSFSSAKVSCGLTTIPNVNVGKVFLDVNYFRFNGDDVQYANSKVLLSDGTATIIPVFDTMKDTTPFDLSYDKSNIQLLMNYSKAYEGTSFVSIKCERLSY